MLPVIGQLGLEATSCYSYENWLKVNAGVISLASADT